MKKQYGWVVVGAGALMGCVAMGTTFSLAVFLQPMAEATGWSRTGMSMAMTLVFLAMGVGGFGWGALTDRIGPAARRAGGRGAARRGPGAGEPRHQPARVPAGLRHRGRRVRRRVLRAMMATVTGWFDKHRSLAVSLVSAGMGVAPMTISPFAQLAAVAL